MNKLLSLSVCLLALSACSTLERKNNNDMTTHQHTNKEGIFACPMHPEVTGKQGDKCTKCGMDLKAVNSTMEKAYQVVVTTSAKHIQAAKPVELSFAVKHKGEIVPLDVAHEMKYHLMVVSDDLTWFRHIHPEEQADGTYTITETFPAGGKYTLFSDLKPSDGEPTVDKQHLDVSGESSSTNEDVATKFVSEVDGYKVTLINGRDFKTNRTQDLEISIEKAGKKLSESDLEQYLGASAHIVMIGKVDKEFLHIHPVTDSRFPVFAQTHIKEAGLYRMWAQFKIDGVVHTADFTVDVVAGERGHHNNEKAHHHFH